MTRQTLSDPAPRAASGVTIQLVSPELWDRTVAQFDEICAEQLYVFARSLRPRAQHEPMLFWRRGELVGGSLMTIEPLPLILGRRAATMAGPMQARAGRPDRADIYRDMIEALVAEYAVRRGMLLSVQPRASVSPFNAEADHLVQRGFSRGSAPRFPDRHMVDLRLSDDAQRASLAPIWRSELRKSERAGLSFEHAPAAAPAEFEALRKRAPERERSGDDTTYDAVVALLAVDDRVRPELFFVRHLGEVIAGGIVFKAGERAVSLHGASLDKAQSLRAAYFMQWNIIRWLRDHTTARWYDLGGADGSDALQRFKAGLAGEAGSVQPAPPAANYATQWRPRLARAWFGRVRRQIRP